MLILEKLRNLQMEEEPCNFSTLIVHHLPRNPSIQKRFESSNVNKLWNSKLPEAGAKELLVTHMSSLVFLLEV